ncbi:M23 family metallopeptidase [Candidatus Peregrinibacteria bacterium]|nr:MAG: M23 family metallopeptidase [Candidatus Peregrinibacteria bacterium]
MQPERFKGYHTGVDVEAGDLSEDVPVFSIADGEVFAASEVEGYGGVLVLRYSLQGETLLALYGHVDRSSLTVSVGDEVKTGQILGFLGEAYSEETDGERKHLHFALIPGEHLSYLQFDYWDSL